MIHDGYRRTVLGSGREPWPDPRAPLPQSWRDRVLVLVVPALLVVVATIQITRVVRLDQSSWSGAGYGMFATYEYEDTRTLRVVARAGGVDRAIALPTDLSRAGFEARVVPTERRLHALAERVLDRAPDAESVTVQVWGIDVSTGDRRVGADAELVATATAVR
jgi:hypothetical protein